MNTKILIIEDEPEIIDNIKTLLEAFSYSVFAANDGKTGINLAREVQPDLIICDIMMPEMDGYEVIQELNKDNRTSLIPFIYLTAKVEHKDFRKGMELGADDYLFKPFSSKELLSSIETRLKKSKIIKAYLLEEEHSASKTKKMKSSDSILLQINNTRVFVKIERIKYILAERQYTNVFLKDGKRIVLRKSLNDWESILPENQFIRIHRTTIINILYVTKIEKIKVNSYKAILQDITKEFEISRRYNKKIREHFILKTENV